MKTTIYHDTNYIMNTQSTFDAITGTDSKQNYYKTRLLTNCSTPNLGTRDHDFGQFDSLNTN